MVPFVSYWNDRELLNSPKEIEVSWGDGIRAKIQGRFGANLAVMWRGWHWHPDKYPPNQKPRIKISAQSEASKRILEENLWRREDFVKDFFRPDLRTDAMFDVFFVVGRVSIFHFFWSINIFIFAHDSGICGPRLLDVATWESWGFFLFCSPGFLGVGGLLRARSSSGVTSGG